MYGKQGLRFINLSVNFDRSSNLSVGFVRSMKVAVLSVKELFMVTFHSVFNPLFCVALCPAQQRLKPAQNF